ncbi:putative membrane protein [Acinetobacter sp. 1566109]|nr:putative membrane protein [Acinetobacter sp. 1566109]
MTILKQFTLLLGVINFFNFVAQFFVMSHSSLEMTAAPN